MKWSHGRQCVGEVDVGYLNGMASVIPPEVGTLAPDEPLLCKTGTVPGSGLVLNVAAVAKSIGLRKQLSHCKGTLSKGD